MNERTAKLLRLYSAARSVPLGELRRQWEATPKRERIALRAKMSAVVRAAKEEGRSSRALALLDELAKETDPIARASLEARVAQLRAPYRG